MAHSFYTTQKRRVVVALVNRSTTSGKAAFRALLSSLEAVTAFRVILYSPARSSSEGPITALITSFMASASRSASSMSTPI